MDRRIASWVIALLAGCSTDGDPELTGSGSSDGGDAADESAGTEPGSTSTTESSEDGSNEDGSSEGDSSDPSPGDGPPEVSTEVFAPAAPDRGIEGMLDHRPGVGLAAAWYEAAEVPPPGPESPAGSCGFAVRAEDGRWSTALLRDHPDYAIGGNPVVAIGADGTVHALCMSVHPDYSGGVLEIASSTDGGTTWSDWSEIVARTGGIPDKPWFVEDAAGALQLVFTEATFEAGVDDVPRVRSAIVSMHSSDGGETWSTPEQVSVLPDDPEPIILGAIGSSVTAAGTSTAISWGEYGALNGSTYGPSSVHFTTLDRHAADLPPITVVDETEPIGPISQLVASADGHALAVLWYPAHEHGDVGVAYSDDDGETWVAYDGRLQASATAVGVLDGTGGLAMVWNERDGTEERALFGQLDLLDGQWRIEPTPLDAYALAWPEGPGMYVGAYQGLAFDDDGVLHALWMQWEGPGSTLMLSALRWR